MVFFDCCGCLLWLQEMSCPLTGEHDPLIGRGQGTSLELYYEIMSEETMKQMR
jgi:hypothetical protein